MPKFNLLVHSTAETSFASVPSTRPSASPRSSDTVAFAVDVPSGTQDASRPSTSSSSSTLVPSPTSSEFLPPHCPGQTLRSSWTRKKSSSNSTLNLSDGECKPCPSTKIPRVSTFRKASAEPRGKILPSLNCSRTERRHLVGLSKAKSFCVAEKTRKSSIKPPMPRMRTQPYEAPYFVPRPTSASGLAVPKTQPTRSNTLPPPRRSSPTPPSPTSLKPPGA